MEKQKEKKQKKLIPFIPEGDFYFSKGVEAFGKQKFEMAKKWLNKAMEANPNDPAYACHLSVVYTEIGFYQEANRLLQDVLEKGEHLDCYYLLANNYAHLGLFHEAEKNAKTYIEKAPEGDFTKEANRLLHLLDFDEEELETDLELEDDLLVFQETAFYHMENMEWEQALPIIADMLVLFPEHKIAKHDYAQALFHLERKTEAIEIELDILEENPDSLYSYINLAVFYYEIGETDLHEPYIQMLENVYPMQEQQKLRIAQAFARTGYYKEAYFRFRKLAKSQLSVYLSYFRWYSVVAYKLGFVKKAADLWKEGLRRHPGLAELESPWNKD